MFVPALAAILTFVGAGGFVLSSLFHPSAASDFIFSAAAICVIAGPLIFFAYVMFGLCIEFINTSLLMPQARRVASGPLRDVPDTPLYAVALSLPEGLRRERKGPLNPSSGRRTYQI